MALPLPVCFVLEAVLQGRLKTRQYLDVQQEGPCARFRALRAIVALPLHIEPRIKMLLQYFFVSSLPQAADLSVRPD